MKKSAAQGNKQATSKRVQPQAEPKSVKKSKSQSVEDGTHYDRIVRSKFLCDMQLPLDCLVPGKNSRLPTKEGLADIMHHIKMNGWDNSSTFTVHLRQCSEQKFSEVTKAFEAWRDFKARSQTKDGDASLEMLENALVTSLNGCIVEIVDGFHRKTDLVELRATHPHVVPNMVCCKVFNTLNDVQYMIVARHRNKVAHTVAKTTLYDNVLYIEFLIAELKKKIQVWKKLQKPMSANSTWNALKLKKQM
jgi:hypothetical protein